MFHTLDHFLRGRSQVTLTALSAFAIASIGAADFVTGYYLSLGIFYVAPVAALAWYGSRAAGLVSAFGSAVVWYFVNSVSPPPEVSQAVLVWNGAVRLAFFSVISALVSSLKDAYRVQREMARTDALTGLLNGRAFKEDASLELARARRLGYDVAVLYLDLDDFKALNDSAGHAAGDSLLRHLGRELRAAVRTTDIVGRVGGDEFAIVMANTPHARLHQAASRVHQAVLNSTSDVEPTVTASIGALASDASEDIDRLLQRADSFMYAAKSSRKGSVHVGGEAGASGRTAQAPTGSSATEGTSSPT